MYCPVCMKEIVIKNGCIPSHYPPGVMPREPEYIGQRDHLICTGSGDNLSDWRSDNRCGFCAYCGGSGELSDCPRCLVKTCSECKKDHDCIGVRHVDLE